MPTDVLITAPAQKSRYTVATFITNVRDALQLQGSNRVTDANIQNWLNEAQDIIATETHWYRTSSYISTVAATKEYDLPSSCMTVEEAWWDPNQRRLMPMTPADLEGLAFYSPNWRYTTDATPIYYYVNVNSAIGLHPTPNANGTNALFLVYTALPPHASTTSDYQYIPVGGERALTHYACFKASIRDAVGEGQKRLASFQALWQQDLQAMKRQVEALYEEDMTVIGEFGEMRNRRGWPFADWQLGVPITGPG